MLPELAIDQAKVIMRFPDINAKTLHDPSHEEANIYIAIREFVATCTQDVINGAKWWSSEKGAMTFGFTPLGKQAYLTVAYGWNSKAERHFATWQFNPSKLSPVDVGIFLDQFNCFLPWGYDSLYRQATYNYLEIRFDVVGPIKDECLFFDTRLRSFNHAYEKLGTLYLGKKYSCRQLAIYDKAKEIEDNGGIALDHERLRIEARLRPNLPMAELGELGSPFATLYVIEKARLAAIKHNITVSVFRRRIFEDGMQAQQAFIACNDKKGLLKALQTVMPDWYNPTSIWSQFPMVVQGLTPTALQSRAISPQLATAACAN